MTRGSVFSEFEVWGREIDEALGVKHFGLTLFSERKQHFLVGKISSKTSQVINSLEQEKPQIQDHQDVRIRNAYGEVLPIGWKGSHCNRR